MRIVVRYCAFSGVHKFNLIPNDEICYRLPVAHMIIKCRGWRGLIKRGFGNLTGRMISGEKSIFFFKYNHKVCLRLEQKQIPENEISSKTTK